MFALGSGPIRGFAVTFAIGICITLFTVLSAHAADRFDLGSPRAPEESCRSDIGSNAASHHSRRHQDTVHAAGRASVTPSRLRCRPLVRAALHRRLQLGHRFQGRHVIEVQPRPGGRSGRHPPQGECARHRRCRGAGIRQPHRRADPRRHCSREAMPRSRRSRQGAAAPAAGPTTSFAASRWSGRRSRASSPCTGTIAMLVALARHPDLYLVPLRVAVRRRRDRRRRARRGHDDRLLRRHAARIQPVVASRRS